MKSAYKYFLVIWLSTFAPFYALADQAADKAEFKKLYAEFNDLYANSEAIEPIIEVGEKLYALAPIAYGENSQNTAVMTYNLASLYDEKGGDGFNAEEERAFELYEEYFDNLVKRKVEKDKNYLEQYIALVKTEQNITRIRSSSKYMKTALKIAKEIKLEPLETANLEMILAKERYNSLKKSDAKKLYQSARSKFVTENGPSHFNVGISSFWIAQIDKNNDRFKNAIIEYERTINVLKDAEQETAQAMVLLSHRNLATIYAEDEKDQDATRHIIAFALKKPENNSRKLIDIYRPTPDFPRSAREISKKGNNTVQVTFDIDEQGFTRNIRVYSNNAKQLTDPVVKAVEKHRYIPLVRDGKLMPRKDQNYSYTLSAI